MNSIIFEKARGFVYRNARPLDFALWRYHFENGSADEVYKVLKMYQKSDGGFGYDIEPDCCNVNSTPVATWQAINILNEVGVVADSDIMRGILNYLNSGKDFADGKWFNTVKTNNDYPHAVWWNCNNGVGDPNDNPTVSLAGFVLKYADRSSALYDKAVKIVKSSVTNFISSPTDEPHILRCYLDLLLYCESIEGFDLFDISEFKSVLYKSIDATVCRQTEKWFTEYVTKPSMFFEKSSRIMDIVGKDLCEAEGRSIIDNQLADGAFAVTWLWYNDYTEYYVAANKWKSAMIRSNMLYLRALNML